MQQSCAGTNAPSFPAKENKIVWIYSHLSFVPVLFWILTKQGKSASRHWKINSFFHKCKKNKFSKKRTNKTWSLSRRSAVTYSPTSSRLVTFRVTCDMSHECHISSMSQHKNTVEIWEDSSSQTIQYLQLIFHQCSHLSCNFVQKKHL